MQSETITADPASDNGAESYTYDAVGNRKTLASTIPSLPGSISYTYDAHDRLTTATYDNDGNTTSSGGPVFREPLRSGHPPQVRLYKNNPVSGVDPPGGPLSLTPLSSGGSDWLPSARPG